MSILEILWLVTKSTPRSRSQSSWLTGAEHGFNTEMILSKFKDWCSFMDSHRIFDSGQKSTIDVFKREQGTFTGKGKGKKERKLKGKNLRLVQREQPPASEGHA